MDLINTDSPSGHKPALDRLARRLADRFSGCGASVELVPHVEAGDHLIARFSGPDATGNPILILGHLDTVWGMGEAQRRPARLEDGKIYGPASFDMRGGTTLMLAMAHYLSTDRTTLKRPLTILLDSDEEVGTPTARSLIENEARGCEAVLVLEPCLPGGAVKTARKGVGTFSIMARGVAAHSGADYEKGVSAIREMAYPGFGALSTQQPGTGNHCESRRDPRRHSLQRDCRPSRTRSRREGGHQGRRRTRHPPDPRAETQT